MQVREEIEKRSDSTKSKAEKNKREAAKQLKAEIQKLNEMLFWVRGSESGRLKISDIAEMRDVMLNAYYALQEE